MAPPNRGHTNVPPLTHESAALTGYISSSETSVIFASLVVILEKRNSVCRGIRVVTLAGQMESLMPTCRRAPSHRRLAIALVFTLALSNGGVPLFGPVVHAQAPVGAGFELDAGDLRFIFRQIEIAQAHSAGGELFGPGPNQVHEARLPFGLRTVDGSFNHLTAGQTMFGASDQLFPRMTTPVSGRLKRCRSIRMVPARRTRAIRRRTPSCRDSSPTRSRASSAT